MGKRRHRQTEEYRSPDWKRRLFNGYVAAPLDNYIVLLLSAIGISGLAICAMVMLFQDAAIPENQTQVIFEAADYEIGEYNLKISTDQGDVYVRLDSMRESNRLYQQIDQGAVFSATYDAAYELPGVLLWELRDANTQYVTAEDVHKVLLFEQKDVFIVCTGLVFFAWGGFAGLYYVVSNAERFPKLAKLMIRKEFRRF